MVLESLNDHKSRPIACLYNVESHFVYFIVLHNMLVEKRIISLNLTTELILLIVTIKIKDREKKNSLECENDIQVFAEKTFLIFSDNHQ